MWSHLFPVRRVRVSLLIQLFCARLRLRCLRTWLLYFAWAGPGISNGCQRHSFLLAWCFTRWGKFNASFSICLSPSLFLDCMVSHVSQLNNSFLGDLRGYCSLPVMPASCNSLKCARLLSIKRCNLLIGCYQWLLLSFPHQIFLGRFLSLDKGELENEGELRLCFTACLGFLLGQSVQL